MIDFNTINVLPINDKKYITKEKISHDIVNLNTIMDKENYSFTILTIPKDLSIDKPKNENDNSNSNTQDKMSNE